MWINLVESRIHKAPDPTAYQPLVSVSGNGFHFISHYLSSKAARFNPISLSGKYKRLS